MSRTRLTSREHWCVVLGALACACAGSTAAPTPATISVIVQPARAWYHTDQTIEIIASVTDRAGDAIPDALVHFTAEPAGRVTIVGSADTTAMEGTQIRLDQEGRATITACVVREAVSTEKAGEPPPPCASTIVRVNDGAPSLEIESPAPGAELNDPRGIVVKGSVADRSMVNVFVNGRRVALDSMGAFETAIEVPFGIHHLRVNASDGVTEVSEQEMDVLWAPTFVPSFDATGGEAIAHEDGMALWFGQDFFDDRSPFDVNATSVRTRDMADLLELIVSRLDLNGSVPDPIIDQGPAFRVHVRNFVVAEPRATIDVTDDGLDIFVRASRVEADTSGAISIEGAALPLGGHLRGQVVASGHLVIRRDHEGDPIDVHLTSLAVGVESLEGTFESAETLAAFRLTEGILRPPIENALVEAVRGALADALPSVILSVFQGIDEALHDVHLELGAEPFPALAVDIDGRIRQLVSRPRRDLIALLRTRVSTTFATIHPESRGVAQYEPAVTPFEVLREGSARVYVRLDFLNALLHALWSPGLLSFDVTSELPAGLSGLIEHAAINGLLPPVIRPASPAENRPEGESFVLNAGELELELTYLGQPARFAVSLEAGVVASVVDGHVGFTVAETPTIDVWTIDPPSDTRLVNEAAVAAAISGLWPSLRNAISNGLSFDVPLPELGDVDGLAPRVAGLRLTLSSDEPAHAERGVVVLEARIEGVQ